MNILAFFLIAIQNFTYVETNASGKIDMCTKWTIDEKEENHIAIANNQEGTTILELNPKNRMISLYFKSKVDDLKWNYVRNGNILNLQKVVGNIPTAKNYDLGNSLWIQRFEFGFEPFMQSSLKSIQFYIVNPHDLSLYKLVAKKESRENIFINGKKVSAQKVNLSLPGFKSLFWDAKLWFDETTFDLLKYETNQGPGTPYFTISLQEKT